MLKSLPLALAALLLTLSTGALADTPAESMCTRS